MRRGSGDKRGVGHHAVMGFLAQLSRVETTAEENLIMATCSPPPKLSPLISWIAALDWTGLGE